MKIISDKTRIPLTWFFSFVGVCACVVVTGMSMVFYVSRIESTANQAYAMVKDQKDEMKEISISWEQALKEQVSYLRSIDQRLSRIEGSSRK